jgi:hypothetical protein
VAIERVPPRRAAGAGLALPVFNKLCVAHLIFFRAKRGAIFSRWAYGSRFVLGDYLRGLFVRGFPYPSRLRASRLWGNYATLSGFVSFGFLVLLFSFFVFHLLHYSRINLAFFLVGEAALLAFLDQGRGYLRNI